MHITTHPGRRFAAAARQPRRLTALCIDTCEAAIFGLVYEDNEPRYGVARLVQLERTAGAWRWPDGSAVCGDMARRGRIVPDTEAPAEMVLRRPAYHALVARASGYEIERGAYQGTADDQIGRWYVVPVGGARRRHGRGYATQAEAWAAAYELATECR